MAAELRDEKLDFWIKNHLNVLLTGPAGVGKTARVIQAFERNKLKWKYFSAATMDPWVDFIGIPRVVENGNSRHLELILPKDFQEDSIEAIFMDEFNRSHKKVRNAVMELIQFKSVNGRPFRNLKVVWAAINPEDGDEAYQVEPLDKAQKDRFQVQVEVPNKPCRLWFAKKFGERLAKAGIDWWEGLPEEMKKQVTPRRLEYALTIYSIKGGDVKDVLPHGCGVSKLLSTITAGPAIDRLKEFFDNKDAEAARKYLLVENNYASALKYLCNPQELRLSSVEPWLTFFLPVIAPEKLTALISENETACDHVLSNADKFPAYRKVMSDVLNAGTQKSLVRKIKKVLGSNKTLSQQFGNLQNINAEKPYFAKGSKVNWDAALLGFMSQPMDKTPQRMKIYGEIASQIPEKLTSQQCVDTLELMSLLVGRCWAQTLRDDMKHIMGIVNHCVDQLHKATGQSWAEILNVHGGKFEKLLRKIQEAKLQDKLYCPVKPSSTGSATSIDPAVKAYHYPNDPTQPPTVAVLEGGKNA
jgi:hypothetical protein